MTTKSTQTLTIARAESESSKADIPAPDWLIKMLSLHGGVIFKVISLSLGFGIFLIYFMQNEYFPEFDLLGFGSLLFTSALIGALLTVYMAFGFATPGILWASYFSDKHVVSELEYVVKNKSDHLKFRDWRMKYCFSLPISLIALITIVTFNFSIESYAISLALVGSPAIAAIICSLCLKKHYKLTPILTAQFAATSFISFFISIFVISIFGIVTARSLLSWKVVESDLLAMFISFAVGVIMTSMSTIGLQMKRSYAYLFSFVVGLIAMTLTGTWITMPSAIVKKLGIGNFQAESVFIKKDTCEQLKSANYQITDQCSLSNIHVVWAWGGSFAFKLSDNRLLKIEKDSIGPIIANAKPEP